MLTYLTYDAIIKKLAKEGKFQSTLNRLIKNALVISILNRIDYVQQCLMLCSVAVGHVFFNDIYSTVIAVVIYEVLIKSKFDDKSSNIKYKLISYSLLCIVDLPNFSYESSLLCPESKAITELNGNKVNVIKKLKSIEGCVTPGGFRIYPKLCDVQILITFRFNVALIPKRHIVNLAFLCMAAERQIKVVIVIRRNGKPLHQHLKYNNQHNIFSSIKNRRLNSPRLDLLLRTTRNKRNFKEDNRISAWKYLGTEINSNGKNKKGIAKLSNKLFILQRTSTSKSDKQILMTYVRSIAQYGCETWTYHWENEEN
ncbi:hypothetical protein AGLY_014612 [Aphis glycines]|uniref:Uncharacterized protein n=1 Tax=Aphis glycines TaxID=307491 RepID=A0A6G0T234_APHGL|nr:hypothetical protein AGLY_014612 [Aphis glycines]